LDDSNETRRIIILINRLFVFNEHAVMRIEV